MHLRRMIIIAISALVCGGVLMAAITSVFGGSASAATRVASCAHEQVKVTSSGENIFQLTVEQNGCGWGIDAYALFSDGAGHTGDWAHSVGSFSVAYDGSGAHPVNCAWNSRTASGRVSTHSISCRQGTVGNG